MANKQFCKWPGCDYVWEEGSGLAGPRGHLREDGRGFVVFCRDHYPLGIREWLRQEFDRWQGETPYERFIEAFAVYIDRVRYSDEGIPSGLTTTKLRTRMEGFRKISGGFEFSMERHPGVVKYQGIPRKINMQEYRFDFDSDELNLLSERTIWDAKEDGGYDLDSGTIIETDE
jgi:hypothetical protein